jgi:hypothetical protein
MKYPARGDTALIVPSPGNLFVKVLTDASALLSANIQATQEVQ